MQTHLQIFNYNNKDDAYNSYHFLQKKKEKIGYMKFPPKAVIVYFREKKGFDYKNNYKYGKLANF